ncbi:MAG TPA: TetR/AcrR family transcriptional regulator [Candidatus Latescibacteria bacterium]|nr:TetR/AcrR family transcriptional regulator [Candidatus Latescibacterota bacterium]
MPWTRRGTPDSRQERVLEVAQALFAERGYHNTTMDEIAVRSGIGKGTLYRTFPNKEGLFLAALERAKDRLERAILSEVERESTLLGKLRRAARLYFRFFEQEGELFKILASNVPTLQERFRKRVQDKYSFYVDQIATMLREGIQKGEIRPVGRPESITVALIGACNSVIYHWLLSGKPYPLEEDLKLVERAIAGIAASAFSSDPD